MSTYVLLMIYCRAQFVLLMLVIFTVTLPLLVLAYVAHSVLAVVVTVMTVSTYWAVNEVARDVEDPFLYEPNGEPASRPWSVMSP